MIKNIQGRNTYSYNTKNFLGNRKNAKFSYVYKGTNTKTGEKVVIKKLNPELLDNQPAIKRFEKEANFDFDHDNIQKKIESFKFENQYYIINEYFEGNDLLTFISKNKKTFFKDYSYFKIIFSKTLKALSYLHSLNYIHADIKPANILVAINQNNEIDVKLIDFGQTRQFGERLSSKDNPFSLMYSPPEFILKAHELYNPTCDFYSLGVTMYHALTGKLPFNDYCNPLKLISLQLNYKIRSHKKIAPDIFKIIRKATEKYIFPRPHIYYSTYEVLTMLKKGQEKRYQSTTEFINDIEKLY